MIRFQYAGAAVLAIFLASCGGGESGSATPPPPSPPPPSAPPPSTTPDHLDPPNETRHWLTAQQMDGDAFPVDSPLNNGYFLPVGERSAALHAFSGTLVLESRELGSNGPPMFDSQRRDLFPDIEMRFVSHDGHLVPLDRDRQYRLGDDSAWVLILSPGRVWSEPGDGNRSRASFPFTLTHTNFTQAHNGVATFLYDDHTVSNLVVQVVQETASWEQFDYWGQLSMIYDAQIFPDAAAVVADFDEELAERIPWADWPALEQLVGGALIEFDAGMAWEDISASAVLWDGTLYVTACRTRYGPYPYCEGMRNAVFSVTKSAVAALTLLRLAQKFGLAVLDERIEDHVTVTAAHGGWAGVTFRDALGMASGVGEHNQDPDSGVTFGDESQARFQDFQRANSTAEKLDVVFSYDNYPWGPGAVVRYNSINTFALVAAMDAYLKSQEGPDADIHTMLLEEVYRPIGIRHAPMNRTVEAGGARGLPVHYSGYFPTLDEIARIAQLLQDEGVHDGVALLHPELTAEVLYRRAAIGLEAPAFSNPVERSRYQMSFWSWASDEDEGCLARTPMMLGFGGNMVAVLANGATSFRFTDTHIHSPTTLVGTARGLGSLCP